MANGYDFIPNPAEFGLPPEFETETPDEEIFFSPDGKEVPYEPKQ